MPARSDLDPAEIPRHLLPDLIISERVGEQFRIRLFGSGVAETLGVEATGFFVGECLNSPDSYAEIRAAYEMVYDRGISGFVTGEFLNKSLRTGALHAWSQVILPLSDDDKTVNRAVSCFVGRLHPDLTTSPDWLERQPAKVLDVTCFADTEELKRLCREWNRRTTAKQCA